MATMNVSLPDEMKEWVEAQTQGGAYSNTSDYVRDLIRRDIRRAEGIARLQAEIDKGRNSPKRPFDAMGLFNEITEKATAHLAKNDAA